MHDRDTDEDWLKSGNNLQTYFNHGFRFNRGRMNTIMAYTHPELGGQDWHESFQNIYSSSRQKKVGWRWYSVGDSKHDNAKKLNENRFAIARIGNESTCDRSGRWKKVNGQWLKTL